MSEHEDKESRTEAATPHRQEKLREEGRVATSEDLVGAAAFAVFAIAIAFTLRSAIASASRFTLRAFALHSDPFAALHGFAKVFVSLLGPVVLSAGAGALVVGLAQTRGVFSLTALQPNFERLAPWSNLKNVLPSKQTLSEIGKQALKFLVLGGIAWSVVSSSVTAFMVLPSSAPHVGAAKVGDVVQTLVVRGALAFALLAALDYWHARRKFNEENMMTRKEVIDEHKEQEGDPNLKRAVRRKQRELARRDTVTNVANATVLVTNPTHFAVALKYDPARDPAPIVVAKGEDAVALDMRTRARASGVPIVEHRPLARALHKHARVGRTIPQDQFRATAEVIAQVLRLQGKGGLS